MKGACIQMEKFCSSHEEMDKKSFQLSSLNFKKKKKPNQVDNLEPQHLWSTLCLLFSADLHNNLVRRAWLRIIIPILEVEKAMPREVK